MIAAGGAYALVLAFVAALFGGFAPFAKSVPQDTAARAIRAVAALLLLSFAALTVSYVTSDFSVLNVVQNSHSQKPLLYKITGVWGNHEGSMLLWVLILALWGFVYARRPRGDAAFDARALQAQLMLAAGFLGFILFTSNPFTRVMPPAHEGMDLNPLLQDPALALHPPLLYMGYVGFSIVFSMAVAALVSGQVTKDTARLMRPWVLVAWAALTCGIALGSFWAYYELGWGGFWFWDPVENASLLPWFAGVALFHSVAVLERKDSLKNWTLFLSLLAFALSMLGTFLVRSGVLTSVHAFASDPGRGVFILALLAVTVGGAFSLYAARAPLVAAGKPVPPLSREGFLLLNNLFMFVAVVTVLLGTLYPLILAAFDAGRVTVGPPYYKAIFTPLLLPFALLMAAAPLLLWGGKPKQLAQALAGIIAFAMVITTVAADDLLMAAVFFSGAVILLGLLRDCYARQRAAGGFMRLPLGYIAMFLAHAGFAVMLIGVAVVNARTVETINWVTTNDTVDIAGYNVTFAGSEIVLGKNYAADRALLIARDAAGHEIFLTPEKRTYAATGRETSESAMVSNGLSMLYAVLGDADTSKNAPYPRFVLRLYYHPFLGLVYAGALLMAAGGIAAALARRGGGRA